MTNEKDPFYRAIAPVRGALQSLVESVPSDPQIPSTGSPAMREISLQSAFVGEWGSEPVEHTHMLGAWKRAVAVDCAEAMVRDLREDPAPVFAFKVLSRAALENAASASWLTEPGIAIRIRIARGRNERIHSARETLRLNWLPKVTRQRSERIVETIKETGARLGFSMTKKGWIEEDRPGFTQLLRWMLGDHLGATIANYYSAVAHGTQYGLASAVIGVEASAGFLGVRKAAIGLSSSDVNMALGVAGMGLITAFENERLLMGRDWPGWESARTAALSAFDAAFGSYADPAMGG